MITLLTLGALAGIGVCLIVYPPAGWAVLLTILFVATLTGKTTRG